VTICRKKSTGRVFEVRPAKNGLDETKACISLYTDHFLKI
jgi:hypothetical protein